MKSLLLLMGLALIPHFSPAFQIAASDSLLTVRRNKEYVTHRVAHGETLYSLLRRFGCSRTQFDQLNPQMKGSDLIKTDQVLKFPATAAPMVSESEPNKAILAERRLAEKPDNHPSADVVLLPTETQPTAVPVEKPKITTIHTVAENETLYSICRRYEVPIDEVKRINNLSGDEITLGQSLMIRRNNETIQTGYPKNIMPEKLPSKIVIPDGPMAEKVEEMGIAELIPSNKRSDQLLALHKSAPLGSLMLVRNKATGRQVTVKVIGKLPATGNNENVLVRLSPAAFYRLNPKDIKFSAEVTYYMPPENL